MRRERRQGRAYSLKGVYISSRVDSSRRIGFLHSSSASAPSGNLRKLSLQIVCLVNNPSPLFVYMDIIVIALTIVDEAKIANLKA